MMQVAGASRLLATYGDVRSCSNNLTVSQVWRTRRVRTAHHQCRPGSAESDTLDIRLHVLDAPKLIARIPLKVEPQDCSKREF